MRHINLVTAFLKDKLSLNHLKKWRVLVKEVKLNLTISKGPEFVFVPNVLGKNKNDASLDLENLGLRVKIKGSGKVNNISPAIGAKVKQGAVITLTLTIEEVCPLSGRLTKWPQ